jgi:hypothetical protein
LVQVGLGGGLTAVGMDSLGWRKLWWRIDAVPMHRGTERQAKVGIQ